MRSLKYLLILGEHGLGGKSILYEESVRGKEYKYPRYFSRENDRKQYLPDRSFAGEKPIYEELFKLFTKYLYK